MANKLIDSGKQALDSSKRMDSFIDLALKFWCKKLKFLSEQAKNGTHSDDFNEELEKVTDILRSDFET